MTDSAGAPGEETAVRPEPVSPPDPWSRRALAVEAGVWHSLWRAVTRRRDVPAGHVGHPYVGIVAPTLWLWIGVSLLEIPLFHFLIPWPWARVTLVVLGVWGGLWMLGYAAGLYMYPHLTGPESIRVRRGPSIDLVIPWDRVVAAEPGQRFQSKGGTIQLGRGVSGPVLQIGSDNQLNVHLTFAGPTVLATPKGGFEVTGISFWADRPDVVLEEARRRI